MAPRKNQGRASSDSRNMMRKGASNRASARSRAASGASGEQQRNSSGSPRRIAMPKSSRPRAGARPDASRRPQQTETDRILSYYVSQDAERRRSQSGQAAAKRTSSKKGERKAQPPRSQRKSVKGKQPRKGAAALSAKNEVKKGSATRDSQRRKGQAPKQDTQKKKSSGPVKQPSVAVSRVLVGVIIVAMLGLSGALLAMTPLFPVKDVAVEGANSLTEEEVTQMAAVPEGSTLLRVNTAEIEGRLEDSPFVKTAKVSRELPGTLKVDITEDEIAAIVEITSTETRRTERWAIDSDGVWIVQIPDEGSEEAANIPTSVYERLGDYRTIVDVPVGPAPVAGTKCTDAPVLNALQIINGLSTELKDQVVTVSATDNHNTTLVLEDGVEISFGDSSDIRTKERICLKLLEENEGWIASINVRVVDRPTWRSY
ncbi:MAG: cell division protein FtsQ/DivIB [Eggerthellaceae bacterium]